MSAAGSVGSVGSVGASSSLSEKPSASISLGAGEGHRDDAAVVGVEGGRSSGDGERRTSSRASFIVRVASASALVGGVVVASSS